MKNAICGRVNHFFSSATDVKNNLSMQVLINFTQTRLRTCPSTIHLEMAVLPSLPGWNFMVAERGLMLEMTRLEGAPGSSVQQHNKTYLCNSQAAHIETFPAFCVLLSVCFLHPVSSLSFKENSCKWAHNSLQSQLGFVYSSAHCVWVYD